MMPIDKMTPYNEVCKLLNKGESAHYAGCSRTTIDRWAKCGILPNYGALHMPRYSTSDLDDIKAKRNGKRRLKRGTISGNGGMLELPTL